MFTIILDSENEQTRCVCGDNQSAWMVYYALLKEAKSWRMNSRISVYFNGRLVNPESGISFSGDGKIIEVKNGEHF